MTYDFIAIGDTVTDDFIEIEDVHIHEQGDEPNKEICLRFGDKVPYKQSVVVPAVGNAANAAVSATRLGLKTAFLTDVGTDKRGDKQKATLEERGVDSRWVEQHDGMESNYHYVLRKGAERTILIKHHEYPYEVPSDLEPATWFYFSSVGEHGLDYHFKLAEFLKEHPESKLAFQPGTFQIGLGADKLKELYELSETFFCNKEEAQRILKTDVDEMRELLKGIHGLGPSIAVVTDGPNGAYAYDGTTAWFSPMYPDPKPPVDRTGAGDSFSSTFTAARALGHDIPTALSWGPVNSMSVVQYIGAQEGLLTREKLEKFLETAPDNYKPQQLH